jgi:YceI-like protein
VAKPKEAHINRRAALVFLVVFAATTLTWGDSAWTLAQATLTYHISHPLHAADGVSHEARGKGMCEKGECSFLIAVPVKSFDSGDSNRDLHMLQVTRGAQYPMVVVRTQFPESAIGTSTLRLDVEVQFAGQTAQYKQVPFQVTTTGNQTHITGTIPATLTDFKIDAPTLLTIPIKNQIPVDINTTWKKG